MYISLDELSSNQVYFTLTQTLIPRPIAWVMSDNGDNSYNLAPFSYFNAICSDPPLIMLSVGKKPDNVHKDTRTNIEARDHFIIHIASANQLHALNQSSATLDHGHSELEELNLELTSLDSTPVPRIKDCPIAYICKRYDIQEIGNNRQSLIIGEVIAVDLNDNIYEETESGRLKIDAGKVDPLMRLGGIEYATLGEIKSIKRPK